MFVERQVTDRLNPLILVIAGPEFWSCIVSAKDLRSQEKEIVYVESDRVGLDFLAIYDLREKTQKSAIYSIITTMIVCAVLLTANLALTFTNNVLLIRPVEIMVKKVQRISKNPVKAAHQEEDDLMALTLKHKKRRHHHHHHHDAPKNIMETIELDMTLTKVGKLLAYAFGEAGSEIIANNISDSSEINTMAAG